MVEDFQANWDLVEAPRRLDRPPPPRPVPTALDERAPSSSPRRRRPATRQAEVLAQVADARRRLGRDRRPRRDARRPRRGRERATAKPQRWGNKANWAARRAGSTRCGPPRRPLRRPSTAPWRRGGGTGGSCVGAMPAASCSRARRPGRRRHARVPRPARAGPPPARRRRRRARARLHDRYPRILLDEFQDTDPIQFELAAPPDRHRRRAGAPTRRRSAGARAAVRGRRPEAVHLPLPAGRHRHLPRRRRAGSADGRESLTANFRSSAAVIDWVNGVFGDGHPARTDVQPAYEPLTRAAGPRGPRHGDRARRRRPRRRRPAGPGAARSARPTRSPPPSPRPLRDRWPVGDGDGRPAPVPCPRHRHPAPGPHVAADARDRARRRAASPTGPRTRRSCTSRPRSATCSGAPRPPPTRPTSWRSSPRCARPLYGCSDVELYDWRRAGGRLEPVRRRATGGSRTTRSPRHWPTCGRSRRRRPRRPGRADRAARRAAAGAGGGPRRARRPRRVAADPLRRRPGPGVDGRRRAGAAPLPALGQVPSRRRPGRRHDPARARPRRGADDDRPRGEGPGVPDHRRVRTDHADAGAAPRCRSCGRRELGAGPEGPPAVRRVPPARRADERRRTPAAALRRLHARRRPPRGVAAPPAGEGSTRARPRRPAPPCWPRPAPQARRRASVDRSQSPSRHRRSSRSRWRGPIGSSGTPSVAAPWPPRRSARSRRPPRLAHDASPRRARRRPERRRRPGAAQGRGRPRPATVAARPLRHGDRAGRARRPAGRRPPPGQRRRTAERRPVRRRGHLRLRVARRRAVPLGARRADRARRGRGAEHWRELFVVAELGGTVLEGYVDLLVRTSTGLVIVDYKTDRWSGAADRSARARPLPAPARRLRRCPRGRCSRADQRWRHRVVPDRRTGRRTARRPAGQRRMDEVSATLLAG